MSNDTKKLEQKEKAKKKCIKILNISCYIGTFLLVLLLLLTGLQSCKQDKGYSSVSAEAPTIQVENLARTQWHFNDVLDAESLEHLDQYDWQILFETQAGTRYQYIFIDDYTISYRYDSDSEPYYAYSQEYGWDGVSGQNLTFYGDYTYLNYNNEELIDFLEINASLVTPLTTFTFNKEYNYNAPLGVNLGITGMPILNDLAWVDTSKILPPSTATETTARLYLLPFYANGTLYNSIISHYAIARDNSNVLYLRNNTDDIIKAKSSTPVFTYMEYAYFNPGGVITDSTTPAYKDIVNIRDTTQEDVSGNSVDVYELSTTWINDGYRYLNFSGYVITGDLSTKLKAFNNNNQVNIYTDNDNDYGQVFKLFEGVFSAIVPFLSIQILPYLSVGLLIFIPLVTAVIFFIVDKIKK